MDHHLSTRFLVISILLIGCVLTQDRNVKFLGQNDLNISEAFFKTWSCLSDLEIDCTAKDIERIEVPLFFNQGSAIKLARNKIKDLSVRFFNRGNVVKIDLSFNKLESISEVTFTNLTNVSEINLSHNYLWQLDSETFHGMPELLMLDLSFNSLSMLNPEIFGKSRKLKQLTLERNNFQILLDDTFEHLIDLEELDLSDNRLSELPEKLFIYNTKLRKLQLEGNQFDKVPSDPLKGLQNLYLLDLSRNRFIRLRYPAFEPLSKVIVLKLDSQNDLRSIGPFTFQGMGRLTYFHASNNKNLRFIDSKAFYDNKTDKSLQLASFIFRHNSVTTLSDKLLNWVAVDSLDLSGNPWACDCHLEWMSRLKMNDDLKNTLTCAYPLYLKGSRIANLTSEDFKCSFLFNHDFTIIGTILLIITISMIMVVCLYIVVKILPCSKIRNPFRKDYGYSKVKLSRNGKNFDLEWDPAIGDPSQCLIFMIGEEPLITNGILSSHNFLLTRH